MRSLSAGIGSGFPPVARRRMAVTAAALLTVVVAMAAMLWHVQGPTTVDVMRYLAPSWHDRWTFFANLAWPGSPEFVFTAVVVLALFACIRRDWFAAALCVAGPAVAAFLVQMVAKPVVDRRIAGHLSFPSGHMTLIAALGALLVLLAYRLGGGRLAGAAAVPATILVALVATGVLQSGWHYLTDVVGGVALGGGAVVAVAAALSAAWPRMARMPHT